MAAFDDLLSCVQEYYKVATKFVLEDFPGGVLGFTATCLTSILTIRYMNSTYQLSKTKEKIKRRQATAKKNIARVRQRVSEKGYDEGITSLPFAELHSKLKSGELLASEVLLAFQAKALEVNDSLNCVTEFIDSAERRAEQLDALDPKDRGPLHGIPISVKESTGVKGTDCTAGLSMFVGQEMPDYSALVRMLIKQGAVPFARTNLSQASASTSCYNPIYGESKNPVQQTRTCGGSSGGEGALIGGGGSVLGIGCDLGGSNRIPAHFCGIVGVKVTPDRLTNKGNFNFGLWIQTLAEVYSPMGRDVDAVTAFLRATIQPHLYDIDPLVPPVPWREEIYTSSKPMRIGYYTTIGGVDPIPAAVRAVKIAKKNLEKMGHTVVEFTPPDILDVFENLFMSILLADDGEELMTLTKNDVVNPETKELLTLLKFPYIVRRLIGKFFASIPLEACVFRAKAASKTIQWWDKNEAKDKYFRKFLKEMERVGVEALLSPAYPIPAWPLNEGDRNLPAIIYTALYNILDFPCGVLPAIKIEAQDVEDMKNYPKGTAFHKFVHKMCEGSEGMPMGVQCATLPFQEEALMRLMKDVETGFKSL